MDNRSTSRTTIKMELLITELTKTGSRGIHDINSPIEVTDISETGIGFNSECIIPEDYSFETCLTIGKYKPHRTQIRIVYSKPITKHLVHYGCSFDQLSPGLREIIISLD